MRLTLAEPKFFKDSISIISELVTEGHFKVTSDAVELVAMDPGTVAMVIFKLFSSSFVEYDIKDTTTIAINLGNLKQVLRRAKPSDQLTLELDENKLKITLKGSSTRTFHLPLIDIEEKEQKIPDLSFKATVTCSSNVINEAIEDVDIIGESVSFEAENQTLKVSSIGDLSKANVAIPSDDNTKIVAEEAQKAKYSIEYLKRIILGSKVADKCVMKFSTNYPMRMEYTVLNRLQLAFILAPRMDND